MLEIYQFREGTSSDDEMKPNELEMIDNLQITFFQRLYEPFRHRGTPCSLKLWKYEKYKKVV